MDSILDLLSSQLGNPDRIDHLSRAIGADAQTTQRAVAGALPVLLGALAGNADRPEGAASLARALENDHDGSLLDDLSGFLGAGRTADGDGILRHALGSRRDVAQQQLGRMSGLDASSAGRLLALLAPVVMGALGRSMRQKQLDASALPGLLEKERQTAEQTMPGIGGMLTQLLDSDGDGQFLDDAARMLGSFLNRR
jgi:hypothetical protein